MRKERDSERLGKVQGRVDTPAPAPAPAPTPAPTFSRRHNLGMNRKYYDRFYHDYRKYNVVVPEDKKSDIRKFTQTGNKVFGVNYNNRFIPDVFLKGKDGKHELLDKTSGG